LSHDSPPDPVQELKQNILQQMQQHAEDMARKLLECPDQELFGQTEFELREQLHQLGQQACQQALDARKKTPPNPKS
jgi:hypothetical protein